MADWAKITQGNQSRSWLAVLPEEIYDKRDTSHIVRLMDALCGDSGVGGLRKRLMMKRLQTSLYETHYGDLDTMYSAIFALPRLESEKYVYPADGLLTWAEQQEMNIKDASYRKRIWDYMLAFQYGATWKGVKLAAEAGCGLACDVIDLTEHYSSLGIAQTDREPDDESLTDQYPVDGVGINDGSSYVIVVDGDLTMQMRKSIHDVISRLSPADATSRIITRSEFLNNVYAEYDGADSAVPIAGVSSSSSWWNVVRMVTGRADWDYIKYPTTWIEPNVKKEAPRQALVNTQEERTDFTFAVKSVSASSEHVGVYEHRHASLFDALKDMTSDTTMYAKYGLSRASSRWYTASYYGGDDVVEWSYPTTLSNELMVDESSRYTRFWSSDERSGEEWYECELNRIIPLSHIECNVSRKPMRVIPYLSSAKDADGNRIWERVRNYDGLELAFTERSWGGGSIAGEMLNVSFDFVIAQADAVRLEFIRLDIPYATTDASGVVTEYEFPWSIEMSNLTLRYDVMEKSDFRAVKYLDPFGNVTETSLREMPAENVLLPGYNYWVSQPNVGEDAVEWLVLDMRDADGKPQRFDTLEIESIYDGCQMNAYSSNDGETWTAYPKVYTLRSGRFELATRTASYLKLEFTRLCAIPYEVITAGIMVETRRFPYAIREHFDLTSQDTLELSNAQRLLTTPDEAFDDEVSDMERKLGVTDIWSSVSANASNYINAGTDTSGLFDDTAYKTTEESAIGTWYGSHMLVESSNASPDAAAVYARRTKYYFYDQGKHEYEVKPYERMYSLAYLVGIKSIAAALAGDMVKIGAMNPFVMDVSDERHLDKSHRGLWASDGSRFRPTESKEICALETRNIQTSSNFRSFEFATNQSPATEKFDHPSDMSQEWSAVNSTAEKSEFGTSGTVLHVTPSASTGYGVESEMKLVHGTSIAQAEVQLFTQEASVWNLECVDTYGEQVFSMRYSLEARKWYTLGTVFNPQPGGGWWDSDYAFRVKIPLDGPLTVGQDIFVPVIDFDALVEAGITTAGSLDVMKDMRLIYFNGISCYELNCDITGNEELWFRIQQAVPKGYSADGAYHQNLDMFYGAYYLYFGNTAETSMPKREWWNVFDDQGETSVTDVVTDANGTTFTKSSDCVELEYRLPDSGFIEFEAKATQDLVHITGGVLGELEIRFLFEYADEDKKVQCYTCGQQLTFVIKETDGYENAYVSQWIEGRPPINTTGMTRIAIAWGSRGSEKVYHNGVLDETDRRRRKITAYMGSDVAWPCINNVYDERHYIEGIY